MASGFRVSHELNHEKIYQPYMPWHQDIQYEKHIIRICTKDFVWPVSTAIKKIDQ